MCWGIKERLSFLFFCHQYVLWWGNPADFVSGVGKACVFSNMELLEESRKSEVCLQRIFPSGVPGSGSHYYPKMSDLGLCLVLDSAGENFLNNSMSVFLVVAPPCGSGEGSQESRFLAEDVMRAWKHVFERRWDVRLWKVLWSHLPRHWDNWHILEGKKTKLLKVTAFLFTASVCTFL